MPLPRAQYPRFVWIVEVNKGALLPSALAEFALHSNCDFSYSVLPQVPARCDAAWYAAGIL